MSISLEDRVFLYDIYIHHVQRLHEVNSANCYLPGMDDGDITLNSPYV